MMQDVNACSALRNEVSESMVELNSDVIDPRKHSVVVFKEIENSGDMRVSLSDTMNFMAKLISSQIDIKAKKNCQGCASSKFPRIFCEYNQEYKPDIISLLENRVSGGKFDSIIASLGFQYSHRVETISFSGGI
ncbi:hypothetical protein Gorai_000030 [Gossypium raimondii]|uniref:Uncharacterized protein n=1 Tax=Gossypium raimondii TaxID=29730 RepID=A0A7J8QQS8_GOSRA|nr:hypothetical protein [Gossypium raimondii]